MSAAARLAGAALLGAALLAGCFESDEERALGAYRDRDYDTARTLATRIAEEGNPRGFELLALMAAQGLGGEVDFAAALALVERAIALDPSYRSSRETIEGHIEARAEAAERAFASGRYEPARVLSAPLAASGHEAGAALHARLHTGQYVALDGSAMSWRDFLDRCSGNTRRETGDAEAAFAAECRGKPAVWEGVVSGRSGERLLMKMAPGRLRARHDLALDLAEAPDPALAAPGTKVRFEGVVAARGDAYHPDLLADARVLGRAALSPEEEARKRERESARELQLVMSACRKMLVTAFRARHAPGWIEELRERASAEERQRIRPYYYFGIDTPAEGYRRLDDGSWRARVVGYVRVLSPNDQISSITDFVALCRVDADHASKPREAAKGTVTFESVSEPRFES